MRRVTPIAAALALAGCTATLDRAVGKNVSVSPLLAEDCRAQCDRLKMRLAAVVVTSSVGACVCEPPAEAGAPATPRAAAGAAAVGLAIAAAEAEDSERMQEVTQSAPIGR